MKTSAKKLKGVTCDEWVDAVCGDTHSCLLKDGGQGMRLSLFKWVQTTIVWLDAQREKAQGKKNAD